MVNEESAGAATRSGQGVITRRNHENGAAEKGLLSDQIEVILVQCEEIRQDRGERVHVGKETGS